MVKELIQLGISGAENILASAEKLFAYTLDERGGDTAIAFPDTAFYLPFAYAFLGEEIGRVRDLQTALDAAKQLVERNGDKTVEKALDAGMAALLASEIIAVIRFLEKEEPQQDCEGFFTDSLLRSLGLQLAGGKMAGIALIIGSAPDAPSAATLVREFQEKNILTLAGGNSKGTSIIDQLKESGLRNGWEHHLVFYGRDIASIIFPINWAIRVALTFGAVKKGDTVNLLRYTRQRIPAVGVKLGEMSREEVAVAWGAMNLGFPIVVNADIPGISLPGICTYEALAGEPEIRKIADMALHIRGIKPKISRLPIPISYSAAFEGEKVRKEDMYVQFGGTFSTSFEFVTTRKSGEIEDGRIEIRGKEIADMEEEVHQCRCH